jgi:hypothetical protein
MADRRHLGLGMAVIGFGYAMYLSTQVKLVPYIVEVDKLGTASRQASRSRSNMPTPASSGRRSATSSPASARSRPMPWCRSNISTGPMRFSGRRSVDREDQCLVPRQLAVSSGEEESTVAIEVNNIVALSNQTYQIDWTEYERDRKGKETGTRRFRGIATVALTAPQDEAIIRLNPIGLYVPTSTGPHSSKGRGLINAITGYSRPPAA